MCMLYVEMCMLYALMYRYVFQSMIYKLVEAGMIDTAGSSLAQMEK